MYRSRQKTTLKTCVSSMIRSLAPLHNVPETIPEVFPRRLPTNVAFCSAMSLSSQTSLVNERTKSRRSAVHYFAEACAASQVPCCCRRQTYAGTRSRSKTALARCTHASNQLRLMLSSMYRTTMTYNIPGERRIPGSFCTTKKSEAYARA